MVNWISLEPSVTVGQQRDVNLPSYFNSNGHCLALITDSVPTALSGYLSKCIITKEDINGGATAWDESSVLSLYLSCVGW